MRKRVGVTRADGLHDRLRQAMDAAGLNDAQLAERLNTKQSTVSGWFKGGRIPGGDHLMRLPPVLMVSGHWLLTGDGEMRPTPLDEARWRLQLVRNALSTPYPPRSEDGGEPSGGVPKWPAPSPPEDEQIA